MPTALWAVRSALATIVTAAVAPLGTAEEPVTVLDGPRTRGATPKKFVLVGAAGDPAFDIPPDEGGTATQTFSTEGPGDWRDEIGAVSITVVGWTGDTEFAALRTEIEEVCDAIEAAVGANRTLTSSARFGEVTGVRFSEAPFSKGIGVQAVLTISYQATLTT